MNIKKILIYFVVFTFLIAGSTYAAQLEDSKVSVPSAILVETNTNKVLYEKNPLEKRYPASTTKIMTAILAIENCSLDEQVLVSYDAVSVVPDGYSSAGLVVGEILTVEQLLHLTLIESANDAANLLAIHIAGSIDSFASMMNTKAYELGCQNTHFVNPDGQHNENHYSCSNDLYLIAKYAMKNDTFRNIVKKNLYVLYPTNKYSQERHIYNTNLLLDSSSGFYDKRATGIKTGFTTPAGNCLIASASYNNIDIIVVVLGGLVESNNTSQRYTSVKNLINYAFDNYSYKNIIEKNAFISSTEISNATKETKNLSLLAENAITAFVNNDNSISTITPTIELKQNIFAPIKSGDILGTATYNIDGTSYTTKLIAANNVEISEFSVFVLTLLAFMLILYLIFKVVRSHDRNKTNN